MDKPFTLKIQEAEQKIVEELNKSELPAFNLKIILTNLIQQLDMLDQKAIEEYEKSKKEDK